MLSQQHKPAWQFAPGDGANPASYSDLLLADQSAIETVPKSPNVSCVSLYSSPMPFSLSSTSHTRERQTMLHLIRCDLGLRCLSRYERLALGVLCVCKLVLLAALQHGRVFNRDEIGTGTDTALAP